MTLTIIGLGPGHADDITRRAWRTLETAETVYLRTERHPCVPDLPQSATYHSFDHLYETHDAFDDVYNAIADTLITAAQSGDVVYAVPGDPHIAESTVAKLREKAAAANIALEIVSGVSFIEPTCTALNIDALDGLQLVDALDVAAMHHPPLNPDYPALLAQVYSRAIASEVKLVLMNQYPDDFAVTLVHSAGADGLTEQLPLYEIDRSEHINHLTSLYIPAVGQHTSFESFQETIAHLRAPEGCPWDREQTHASLRPYLIEEAYEVLDALNRDDTDALKDELGDLLLQIVLHTQIATEFGEFTMADVMQNVNGKMIRRHPHVWGDVTVDSAGNVVTNWEAIKQQEKAASGDTDKGFKSVLDDVPASFTPTMKAAKYAKRASKVGFDYPDLDSVKAKITEELAEIDAAQTPEELLDECGDLMFAAVDVLRYMKVDPEVALEATNVKFARRFRHVERRVYDSGRPMTDFTLDELDGFWREAKKLEKV
ncbi:MAG: nucleoside triphosphate pyrophosphohydrolase, partial [Chloroflexota bacterium]